MAQNTVFLLMTAIIRNFYKAIIQKMDVKMFGLKRYSRIKTFVFKFVSVPAKWIRMARQNLLNVYTDNETYHSKIGDFWTYQPSENNKIFKKTKREIKEEIKILNTTRVLLRKDSVNLHLLVEFTIT